MGGISQLEQAIWFSRILTRQRYSRHANPCYISISIGSDIIHLSAAGKDIVVLNSFRAMNDLFDKRSSIYSSR